MKQGQGPGREWSLPLPWMLPVWRQIQQVVQQVNAGCAQAECKEGERRVYYGFWFEQTVRGKQWNQYQKELDCDSFLISLPLRSYITVEFLG